MRGAVICFRKATTPGGIMLPLSSMGSSDDFVVRIPGGTGRAEADVE